MVKIIRRQSLGKQPVYDIGVVRDHNFILNNGFIAANCFNKSHSTAYAYVTYQTAYLKANYPVEYMTALLTASSDDKDKIEKYRENCQKMGITVEPPDLNRSQKNFTPIGQKILFGLSAVRNLGEGAIDIILKAREEAGGKFESLADFCAKVDLRVVNRKALETLILCGAFDKLNTNRNQLIHDLEYIIPWVQKRAKEKESGQMNLLDLLGNSLVTESQENEFEQAPNAPSVADFSLQERLRLEKERLGFYVSEHPLKAIQKTVQILSPINLSDLPDTKSRKKVSAVAMITSVKNYDQKRDTNGFLALEDASGQSEAVVFLMFMNEFSLLVEDTHLIVWGKVDQRDDKIQLIIEDAESIETAKMVMVQLTPQEISNPSKQQNLRSILQGNTSEKTKGKIPVVAIIGTGQNRQFVRLGQSYWVEDEYITIQSLTNAGFSAYVEPLIVSS